MATTVPKISLADILEGVKGINGTKTTTTASNSAFNQQALDQLMRTLLSSSSQYGKTNALNDATGITQRVTKAIQAAQPQLLSAQMGSGLRSSTTGSLLQNDLVNQIMMSEGALQQQQIKDYATIQNQQAQAAANLAQVGTRTTEVQTPGVGLQGMLAPLALSMGGQYAYDKLFGDAKVGKQLASTLGGNVTGTGAPVTDYSGLINGGSAQANGLTETTMAARPDVNAWDVSANGATGDLGAASTSSAPSGFAGMASNAGFDVAPGFANTGGGLLAAVNDLAHGTSIGQAGMEGGKAYLAMSNPYTAAAYLVDQATGGAISQGLTDVSKSLGVKQPIDDLWQGASNILSAPAKAAGSVICTALAHHGLASADELKASTEYRSNFISLSSYLYYLQWATPYADAMTIVRPEYWTGKQRLIAWGAKQYIKYVTGTASLGTKALVSTGIAFHDLLAKVFYKPQEEFV